jgi:hypothetical protein
MEWIFQNWDALLTAATAIITAAAAITALTPSPKDDNIVAKVRKVLDVLALNVGNAKNKK